MYERCLYMCNDLGLRGGDVKVFTSFWDEHAFFRGWQLFSIFFFVFCGCEVIGMIANMCFFFLSPVFGFTCFAYLSTPFIEVVSDVFVCIVYVIGYCVCVLLFFQGTQYRAGGFA